MDKEENQLDLDSGKEKDDELIHQTYVLVPKNSSETNLKGNEIDVFEILSVFMKQRKTIIRFVVIGVVFGLFAAFITQEEFISTSTLLPEYSAESQGGGASQLLQRYGGLIGLGSNTYNSSSNAIRVDLYPEIVQSLTFHKKLIDQEFYFPSYDTTVSVYDFFEEVKSPTFSAIILRYTVGLPYLIKDAIFPRSSLPASLPSDSSIVSISKSEIEVINIMRERVTANLNEETGVLQVVVKMPDRIVSSNIAKFTIEELTTYLTDYRTEKVQRDLRFIEEQLEDVEKRFQADQLALAEFRDSNQGSLTAKARTEEQKLNSEYEISFNLYNSLTQQREEAKLKVQEETPVFKILQPVLVPVERSEPKRTIILAKYVFFSLILSIGWIFAPIYLKKLRQEIK